MKIQVLQKKSREKLYDQLDFDQVVDHSIIINKLHEEMGHIFADNIAEILPIWDSKMENFFGELFWFALRLAHDKNYGQYKFGKLDGTDVNISLVTADEIDLNGIISEKLDHEISDLTNDYIRGWNNWYNVIRGSNYQASLADLIALTKTKQVLELQSTEEKSIQEFLPIINTCLNSPERIIMDNQMIEKALYQPDSLYDNKDEKEKKKDDSAELSKINFKTDQVPSIDTFLQFDSDPLREKVNKIIDLYAKRNEHISDIDKTIELINEVIEYEIDNILEFRLHGLKAGCYAFKGEYHECIDQIEIAFGKYYLLSEEEHARIFDDRNKVKTSQNIKFTDGELIINYPFLLNLKAIMYSYIGEYRVSINHLYETLELHQKYGNMLDLADTLFNLGTLYKEIKEIKSAINYYRRAIKTYQELELVDKIFKSNRSMILLFISIRNYPDGLIEIEKGIEEFKNNNGYLLSFNYLKSYIFRCQGELKKENQLLDLSVEIYNSIETTTSIDQINYAHCLFSLILINIECDDDNKILDLFDELRSLSELSKLNPISSLSIIADAAVKFKYHMDLEGSKDILLDIINTEGVYIATFALQLFHEILVIETYSKSSDLGYIKDLLKQFVEYTNKNYLHRLELQFTSLKYKLAVIENDEEDQIRYLNNLEQIAEEYNLQDVKSELIQDEAIQRDRTEIIKNVIRVNYQNYAVLQYAPPDKPVDKKDEKKDRKEKEDTVDLSKLK